MMADRRISNYIYVTLACLYGTETLALTELQQQRLQVYNWVRKIARERGQIGKYGVVKGRDMTERLVMNILQWAGHVDRVADDRLPMRSTELREEGRIRRGRPMLRWEDCDKRDVRKAGGRATVRRRHETEEGGKYYQMRR